MLVHLPQLLLKGPDLSYHLLSLRLKLLFCVEYGLFIGSYLFFQRLYFPFLIGVGAGGGGEMGPVIHIALFSCLTVLSDVLLSRDLIVSLTSSCILVHFIDFHLELDNFFLSKSQLFLKPSIFYL